MSTRPYERSGKPLDVGVGAVNSVGFSPDGTLAVSGGDGAVELWDVGARKPLDQLDVGPAAGVAFSPDGKTLVVASNGREVQLWDVHTRTPVGTLLPGVDGVKGVAVSSDGRVVSGSNGSTVSLWEGFLWKNEKALKQLVCKLVWGKLSEDEWKALTPGLAYRTSCD